MSLINPEYYRIEISGKFDSDIANLPHQLKSVYREDCDVTFITGIIPDQALLHGILTRAYAFGHAIILVQITCPADAPEDMKGSHRDS